jgi:hypothetical protein
MHIYVNLFVSLPCPVYDLICRAFWANVLVRCVIRSKFVGVRILLFEILNLLQTVIIIITFMQGIFSYVP